jgi:uroporphyrinogen-III synthase
MLLHPRGDRVAFDLKGALASKGFRVSQPVLYRMTAREALSPNITGTIRDGRLGGVILMSPRTARCYIELIESGGLGDQARRLRHFCLSAAVAEPLYPLGGMAVAVAARPCRRELLALIAPEADTGPDPTQ